MLDPRPTHHTAYWSHKPPAPPPIPLDLTICFTDGCGNPAATQPDPRWAGRYCQPCQSTVLPSLVYAETER